MATSQSVPTDRSQWMSEDHNKVADAIVELQGIANGGSISAIGDVALPIAGATVQLADRSEPTFLTIEEGFVQRSFDGTLTSAGGTVFKKIFVAPFPLVVRDIWASNDGSDLTGLTGSIFWSLRPRRYRITQAGAISASTEFVDILDSTGTNYALVAAKGQGQPFQFTGVTYDPANAKFRTGDALWMRIAPSGSPNSLVDISFTVRIEPQ